MNGQRVFGWAEVAFDGAYLLTALSLGGVLIGRGDPAARLAGIMAFVLAFGDAFHLAPRMLTAARPDKRPAAALGAGKLVTSITMTVFYVLLWHVGTLRFAPGGLTGWTAVVYALAACRIVLCLCPQNRWLDARPPVVWGIYRNVPFLLLGMMVAGLFLANREAVPGIRSMGPAIVFSFACYLPVVLFAEKNPRLGMLMLPKTCAYVWMLTLCLSL